MFVGEYVLLQVGGANGEETISTTFVFALLLTEGVAVAVMTQVVASLLVDVLTRKRIDRALFNVAQLALSWTAAGIVVTTFAGDPGTYDFSPPQLDRHAGRHDRVLRGQLHAGADRRGARPGLQHHLSPEARLPVARAWPAAMLMGLGPPVAAVAHTDLLLVPLLILPIAAIHRAAQQATQMEHLAMHDSLSGLPTRLLFEDVTTQAILGARRTQSSVVVMLLDLDGFKSINDTLGHDHGDELLRAISKRLRDGAGDETLARLGGDEFAILLRQLSEPSEVAAFAERILDDLERPVTLNSVTLHVRGSMGIARYPDDGEDVGTLLRHADAAMYSAKRSQRRHEFFVSGRDDHSPGRLAMAGELRRALEEEELDVHYQPQVQLASGTVSSVESLVRWVRPGQSPIPPSEFITVAEHTGLIAPLTKYVLERAIADCAAWRRDGLELAVAVNLSVRSILDHELPGEIAWMLSKAGLEPACLELEITESVLMADPGRAHAFLTELRDIGIRLSVDDFGTGYSSLAYLKDLPIDAIKIDRSFVASIEDDAGDAMLVKSIVDLGHNLGLKVVAEGVESNGMLEALIAVDCDFAQGYLFSRPAPPEQIGRWLQRSGRALATVA